MSEKIYLTDSHKLERIRIEHSQHRVDVLVRLSNPVTEDPDGDAFYLTDVSHEYVSRILISLAQNFPCDIQASEGGYDLVFRKLSGYNQSLVPFPALREAINGHI